MTFSQDDAEKFAAKADQLRRIERAYQRAAARAEQLRRDRNDAVRWALEDGWTHQAISDATGLSRGRISQIKERGGE